MFQYVSCCWVDDDVLVSCDWANEMLQWGVRIIRKSNGYNENWGSQGKARVMKKSKGHKENWGSQRKVGVTKETEGHEEKQGLWREVRVVKKSQH